MLVCRFVCVFVCLLLFVCLSATLLKNYEWTAMKFYGGKRNKWLDFDSDLDHYPAMAEVCIHRVLGIWWLSVDIWGQRSITRWPPEWIWRLLSIWLHSLTDKNEILQRVSDNMALAEVEHRVLLVLGCCHCRNSWAWLMQYTQTNINQILFCMFIGIFLMSTNIFQTSLLYL